jgi:Uri superfamily endonuclease
MPDASLPPSGVYALELRARRAVAVTVGRLGEVRLVRGTYLYIGSAQRGLPARVGRHLAREKRRRWHIDHLTTHPGIAVARAAAWALGKDWECGLAVALIAAGVAERAVPGFGASDCRCGGHLLRVTDADWLQRLSESVPTVPTVADNELRPPHP